MLCSTFECEGEEAKEIVINELWRFLVLGAKQLSVKWFLPEGSWQLEWGSIGGEGGQETVKVTEGEWRGMYVERCNKCEDVWVSGTCLIMSLLTLPRGILPPQGKALQSP